MRRRKRPLILLATGIVSGICLAILVLFFPPDLKIEIRAFHTKAVYLFFILLFTFCFSVLSFILASKRQGILTSLAILSYLILSLNNLRNPFFLILIVGIFISIELFFKKSRA